MRIDITPRRFDGRPAPDSLTLRYEVAGEGEPVLYISGSGRSIDQHPNVLDGPLAAAARVLVHDQRGLGSSGNPPGTWSMADYAADAASLVEALMFGPCHVIGVSFGGMVAQELAINHPHTVQRLVLVATSAGGRGGSSYPIHRLSELDQATRSQLERSLADTRHDRHWQERHPHLMSGDIPAVNDGAEPVVRSTVEVGGARKQLEARRLHDAWDRLPDIAAPTLVCAGRFDGVAPLSNTYALATRIPDARYEVFNGGHLLLRDDPDAWPRVIGFLTERSGRSRSGAG